MKKLLICLVLVTALPLNALAQNFTFAQWLNHADLQLNKNLKMTQAAKVNLDVSTYGVCSNVGLAVAAGEVKGEKYSNETLFMAAFFIKVADAFQKSAVANGTPSAVFENSLRASRYIGYSQDEWEKGLQRCAVILNKILTESK
jgi:hypothetical protein